MKNLILRNSVILDGTGRAKFEGDIAIQDGLITKIGKIPDKALKEIDLNGAYVTPGFIDVHGHSDYFLFLVPTYASKIQQGITTEVGGNCGYSAAPIWGPAAEAREIEYYERYKLKTDWHHLSEYFSKLRDLKISVNYSHLIGHNTIRESISGVNDKALSANEMLQMTSTINLALKEGAVGVSTGLIYPPACYAPIDELISIAKVVKEHDKIFTFHMRSEGPKLIEAVEEVFEIAKATGVRVQISHLKTSGKKNWEKLPKVFELIESAKKEGIDVHCDRYPYAASQTMLYVILPPWCYNGGVPKMIEVLRDKDKRSKIKKEILKDHPEPDYFDNIIIMDVDSHKNEKYQAKSIKEAASLARKDPFEFIFDLLIEEEAKVNAIYFAMNEKNMEKVLLKEYTFVGSDSGVRAVEGILAKGCPHPRIFGSYPRFFRLMVKEKKLLTWEEAVAKCTGLPAKVFKIPRRGEIKVGNFADLVVFSPDRITDQSEYKDSLHYPKGIDYVIVNGEITVDHGRHAGMFAGRPLEI